MGDGQNLLLADSSLSRDLFPGDYHCLGDNENRPIKWMPIEAISVKSYSKASDVVRYYARGDNETEQLILKWPSYHSGRLESLCGN